MEEDQMSFERSIMFMGGVIIALLWWIGNNISRIANKE
jgi:hypothetical protein